MRSPTTCGRALRSIDACLALTPEQLETTVPGTYGSILQTVRHLVEGDSSYLSFTSGERTPLIDEVHVGLPELRAAMEGHGATWSRLLGGDPDPDAVLREVDETDGYERDAPMSIRPRRRCSTGPIIGARSAPPSRRSAWNRRPSTSGTSANRTAAWSRSQPRPDADRPAPRLCRTFAAWRRGAARCADGDP
jgi:hypothetical protein